MIQHGAEQAEAFDGIDVTFERMHALLRRRCASDISAAQPAAPLTRLSETNLFAAIRIQTASRPGACAIAFEGRVFPYEWLDDRSDQLAALLIEAGVGRGDVVGLHLTRSPDLVAAILAILKAGAAYLPLDPEFPEARLEMFVADARPTAVLSEAALDGRIDIGPVPRITCDGRPRVPLAPIRPPEVDADDLAYVLYTSGSTGRPKGVEITHGAVMNLLNAFLRRPGFTSQDCMLGATTTAFDISVLEIFMPLTTGGRIALASPAAARDPQALAALIATSGCTFAQATPSKWRYIVEAGWLGRPGLTLICGGEALTRDLADQLLARCDALWNVYGPTETTVWSTMARVEPGEGPPPIGWPIDRTELVVVAEDGEAVADGQVGELHIGGAGLARGYRGQPELTAERFVTREGRRLYRTGDLVRRRGDGALECLGRTDHQVKIRGFRVELGEVEAALLACPGVAWAAALTWAANGEEAVLVAYLTLRAGAEIDPVGLRRALGQRLPSYMIPSRIVALDVMPMTPNGKVDRKALPAPDAAPTLAASGPTAAAAGMTEGEAKMAAIWADILGVDAVAPHDNFFDLGGYSLLTLHLLRRIQLAFGRTLTMADLFAAKDLRAMTALVEGPQAARPTHIVLQGQGSRPPLVWFDVGPQLRGLAAALAPEQPFVGLNLDPEDEADLALPLKAVEVGERLVRKLRAYQRHGPYYLGGWCRWGVMAFAAARQLRAEGEEVPLLVLLDAINTASAYQTLKRATRTARRGMRSLTRGTRPLALAEPEPATFTEHVEQASRVYRPAAYPGDVLLLRANDGERDWDGCSGWRDVVKGRLEVCDLDGDHAGILKAPCVTPLAHALLTGLESAQDRNALA